MRPLHALCLLAAIGLCLVLAPAAVAKSKSKSFTWDGGSTTSGKWSVGANWSASAPTEEEEGTFTFPELSGCTAPKACYSSGNDLSGLSAESLHIDDGDNYIIKGEELTLGGGGLTASPEGGTTGARDEIAMPLELTASQTWSVVGSGGGGEKDGLLLEGAVEAEGSGTKLTIDQSKGSALVLGEEAEMEVPVTIKGAIEGGAGFENGSVELLGGEIEVPVELRHISFSGYGEVGALSTYDAELDIKRVSGNEHVGLEASSVTLDPASKVRFQVDSGESSELFSTGAIALGEATLEVDVAGEGKTCPALEAGHTYTFVETEAPKGLSSTFGNAPESGAEIPIHFAEGCPQAPQTMRIAYGESNDGETVTGTVQEVKKQVKDETGQHEEKAPEAAATSHQEEAVAKTAVLGAKEGSPDATLASTSLSVSSSGAFVVKIECPAGETSCTGTITLRTLHAVSAGSSGGKGKSKPAVLTLAAGSFTVAGGQTKVVTLHLSATARKLLARDHTLSARATIVAHNPTGGAHTGQTTVTLHAPKPKHGKG